MVSAKQLLDEFKGLGSAEERLEWLVERQPLNAPLSDSELRDELLVPECISRLWFQASAQDGQHLFRTRSDSKVVQAVATFICDIYSDLTAAEIRATGDLPLKSLQLEQLLSFNRRRTVERLSQLIQQSAAHS